jgi:hypothetical protein
MRKQSLVFAVVAILAATSGDARAASLGFAGSLAIQIATLDPVVIPGSGNASVNGSGPAGHLTGLALPASPFATTGFVQPISDPGVFPIAGVQFTAHNGAGAFAGVGGAGFGGVMPILGTAKVCLYGSCSTSNNIANVSVPLSVVGAGGASTVMGQINMTVFGAPWTTGTAAIGTITRMGFVSPASSTGAASGLVTLVTPVFISTNVGSFAVIPAFAFQTLHLFVPEPGTLVLLCLGVGALGAYGRSRLRD